LQIDKIFLIFAPYFLKKMNLPADFTDYTRSLMGDECFDSLAKALEESQSVSIRLNDKLDPTAASTLTDKVPWCEAGRYIALRPSFTFDPLFHAGCYYVQEASSMFVERAIKQYVDTPVVALDLCAAPGGKSTHLSSTLPEGSLLVSNEVMRQRAQILAENVSKWGNTNVVVTSNQPADFAHLRHTFDVLLTDMPCSGEGMFRKNSEAVSEWSKENVVMCAQRQRDILTECWQCLSPGGLLIYSTCTFNTLENEENIQWIVDELGAQVLEVETQPDWHITGNLLHGADFPVYRFLPGRTRGEGFFLAVLRKSGERPNKKDKKRKDDKKHLPPIAGIKDLMIKANSYINEGEKYKLTTDSKTISAVWKEHSELIAQLSKTLHVLQSGVTIGEIRGHDLVPSQALATSKLLNRKAFASQEISYEQALAYLRRDNIILEPTTPHGCVLLTYRNAPLGFVKNMGNRTNNLYPQEWRIRSGHLPDEKVTLL
jgi:16S rRNA (cytosine1407-C5)-methyltransferase